MTPVEALATARTREHDLLAEFRGAAREVYRLLRHGRDTTTAEQHRTRLAFELIRARTHRVRAEKAADAWMPIPSLSTATTAK
jgi:hypothetical protein